MPHGTVGSTELFKAWETWCASEGEEAGTQKAFATALENKGYDKVKDGTGRMRWKGLRLVAEEQGR
jgi:phage/plasmid-associated DNA primase